MTTSLTREIVSAAVAEYGEAWTTQNADRACSLFTSDAVYVERAYDKSATFRGREAIRSYWLYQICGKQSGISFRHIESDMIIDAERPVAVVKWLAEFDNRRERRRGKTGPDRTAKRVRFVQMAVLHFALTDDGYRISYLEEYAQDCSGGASKGSKSGVRWPGLDSSVSDATLAERIRFDPPPPPEPVACTRCGERFPSRTKLFEHLRETVERDDGVPGCIPLTDSGDQRRPLQTVCISVSYTRPESVDEDLSRAIGSLIDGNDGGNNDTAEDVTPPTLSWAVPPTVVSTAVLNVAAVRIPRHITDGLPAQELSARLNKLLGGCGSTLDLTMATVATAGSDWVHVHGTELTDRVPFVPSRRESERYVAFVPWSVLQAALGGEKESAEKASVPLRSQPKLMERSGQEVGRIDFDSTAASAIVDGSVTKRLMKGTRIVTEARHSLFGRDETVSLGDGDHSAILNRVRTSVMDEPWQAWCRVSVSMKQPSGGGWVERIIALLVAFARGSITEDGLLKRLTTEPDNHQQYGFIVDPFPSEFVCLAEPVLNLYKLKAGVSLCGSSGGGAGKCSDTMRSSIEAATNRTLVRMDSVEKEDSLIQRWCDRLDKRARRIEPSNESNKQ